MGAACLFSTSAWCAAASSRRRLGAASSRCPLGGCAALCLPSSTASGARRRPVRRAATTSPDGVGAGDDAAAWLWAVVPDTVGAAHLPWRRMGLALHSSGSERSLGPSRSAARWSARRSGGRGARTTLRRGDPPVRGDRPQGGRATPGRDREAGPTRRAGGRPADPTERWRLAGRTVTARPDRACGRRAQPIPVASARWARARMPGTPPHLGSSADSAARRPRPDAGPPTTATSAAARAPLKATTTTAATTATVAGTAVAATATTGAVATATAVMAMPRARATTTATGKAARKSARGDAPARSATAGHPTTPAVPGRRSNGDGCRSRAPSRWGRSDGGSCRTTPREGPWNGPHRAGQPARCGPAHPPVAGMGAHRPRIRRSPTRRTEWWRLMRRSGSRRSSSPRATARRTRRGLPGSR